LNWPFQVVDNGGNAGIQIKVGESEETMIVSPEEAGAAVLSNLKKVRAASSINGRRLNPQP
jgi:hypothetical protein